MVSEALFEKEYWVDRVNHREKVLQNLERFLQEKSREALKSLLRSLWASEVLTSVDAAIERRIIERGFTIEEVAKKLGVVKEDPEKLLEEDIPGFGPASITEILFSIDPEKFPLFNKRARIGLKKFGYGDFEGTFTVNLYRDFTKAVERVAQDFRLLKEKVEEKVGINIPKFDFVDGVFNLLYEHKLSVDDINELKRGLVLEHAIEKMIMDHALGSIQGAVKQYLYWLEKGDPEERAMEKATNYALGMITASGVLDDPKKKHSFIIALETMAGLAKGMANLLRELP